MNVGMTESFVHAAMILIKLPIKNIICRPRGQRREGFYAEKPKVRAESRGLLAWSPGDNR